MEAALTLPPTNVVVAGLCRRVRPTQRPLRRDAAQPSQKAPPARRRRCHFLYPFSPTTSTTLPTRLTDQINRTCRTSQARPLLTLRLRHAPSTHTLSTSDRPPPAASCTSASATRLCGESEICIPAPHPCAVPPRAMTARPYSRRQLHLHMLGHAHAINSPASQPQPRRRSTVRHSSHSGFSASPCSAPPPCLLRFLRLLTGHEHDQHDQRYAHSHTPLGPPPSTTTAPAQPPRTPSASTWRNNRSRFLVWRPTTERASRVHARSPTPAATTPARPAAQTTRARHDALGRWLQISQNSANSETTR
jgi:hypothetical protein